MKPIKFDDYKNRYDYVSMERRDGILQLTIHNKGNKNEPAVWGLDPHEELSCAFDDIARDYENQCVIITGAGKMFIGAETTLGGDMTPLLWDPVQQHGKYLLMNHLSIEVPTIAAVNGPAPVHAELGALCDIVLATENAYFQDPHFIAGLVPGDGVQVVWPHLLGPNRGRYFMLTGQRIYAKDALNLGVVNEVVGQDQLLPRAWEIARELCRRPTLVRRYARVAMTQVLKQMMLEQLGYGLALEGLSGTVSWIQAPKKTKK